MTFKQDFQLYSKPMLMFVQINVHVHIHLGRNTAHSAERAGMLWLITSTWPAWASKNTSGNLGSKKERGGTQLLLVSIH